MLNSLSAAACVSAVLHPLDAPVRANGEPQRFQDERIFNIDTTTFVLSSRVGVNQQVIIDCSVEKEMRKSVHSVAAAGKATSSQFFRVPVTVCANAAGRLLPPVVELRILPADVVFDVAPPGQSRHVLQVRAQLACTLRTRYIRASRSSSRAAQQRRQRRRVRRCAAVSAEELRPRDGLPVSARARCAAVDEETPGRYLL